MELKQNIIAVGEATTKAIWIRYIFEEMGFPQRNPTKIFCDSQSCIAMIKNPAFHGRTKHIDRKYHFIRSKVKSMKVEFIYLSTDKMVVDTFTKSLPKAKSNFCKKNLGVHPITLIKRKLVRIEDVTNLKKAHLK